ncbi:hypothetical protein [Thiothrix subterranea]|uniref:DUF302 domain-containing protein n=1 Tax=Thiothrix subterranea TaxID=2735563 RepID=A0AA51QZG7_9GAMM|nr:hypothetical protein [Thiothrix subterranea]MDQ5768405.1 hypothetical protein [Thiothrix subterranea]QQZ28430.1 hypothetical protein HMY34_06475 [Thiothrix subterranea]WML86992.1 hypothetical protein RCG00_01215 [Thiothrix subterranea]
MKRLTIGLGSVLLAGLLALPAQANDKLLTVRSPQAFDLALEQVQDVLKKHNFTVAHIQKCDGGLQDMGYTTDNYNIVFFGRLEEVRELSKTHPELVPLFPFKLAVYAKGKDTLFSVLNPAELAPLLDADQALAAQLGAWEQDFRAVLNEMQVVQVAHAD